MAYSFQEIMAYHSGNQVVYDEIKDHLSDLIPFVGAGLTNFAYGSWPGALRKLAGHITNTTTKQKIRQLIQDEKNDNHLLEAAQEIENARGSSNLSRDMVHLFSAKKLEAKRNQLPREAISLLPYLFPNLVLTTNFDETLETVYRESGHPFVDVFHPGHTVQLRQFLRENNDQGLMKLHGTITGTKIDYDNRIVFTLDQYNRHYGTGSPLVADLTACFRQRMMFFLGCSLEQDRTMALLRQIHQPGEYSYAILNCPKSKRDARLLELDAMGIRAIVYPKGRHEAVRVILEKLLEDTQNDVYQGLSVRVGELRKPSADRFAYNADLIPRSGRDQELAKLQEFLGEPKIAFRWWAIVGPGGSGKSRLAYEFQKQLQSTNWHVRWLARPDYEKLSELTQKLTQPTLLIADYVQQHAQELGKWMQNLLDFHRGQPLRLLLVERNSSQAEGGFSWERQLYLRAKQWELEKSCFAPFLSLQPLDDSFLGEIMTHYAANLADKPLPDAARKMLLERLHFVDPDLQRPLYALFLTDAWLEDPKKPERWDREDVLNYVTLREQGLPIHVIANTPYLLPYLDELEPACLRLYAMATVWQDASYTQLREHCPEDWETISGTPGYSKPEKLLQFIGLGNQDGINALRPDLVGEYFVLSWLQKNKDQAKAFLQTAWQNPEPTAVFLGRTIHDYAHLLNESPNHWQLLFPDIRLESPDAALWAARLLVDATAFCTIPAECTRLAGQLEAIAAAHPNKEITIEFAKGLANLSYHQDATEAADTVNRLEQLRSDHPGTPAIAILFARGLLNLSVKQDVTGRAETVNRLERLTKQQPGIPEIAIAFAQGLVNLSAKQDATEATETVDRLEQLTEQHPDNSEIAIVFASGLFNLSHDQDATGAADTVNRLEQLRNDHPDIPEIAIEFAKGLVNLANHQDATGAADTVNRLEQLTKQHPGIPAIAIAFAQGLVNLSAKQDATEAAKTVDRLKQLTKQHPDVSEIAIQFANGLYNLANNQDATETAHTVKRLEQLRNDHHNVPELAIRCAQGLFNLSCKQDTTDAAKTVRRLEQLTKDHPGISKIAIIFAKRLTVLFHEQTVLFLEQECDEATQTFFKLVELASGTIPVPEIAKEFARCCLAVLAEPDGETKETNWVRANQILSDLNLL